MVCAMLHSPSMFPWQVQVSSDIRRREWLHVCSLEQHGEEGQWLLTQTGGWRQQAPPDLGNFPWPAKNTFVATRKREKFWHSVSDCFIRDIRIQAHGHNFDHGDGLRPFCEQPQEKDPRLSQYEHFYMKRCWEYMFFGLQYYHWIFIIQQGLLGAMTFPMQEIGILCGTNRRYSGELIVPSNFLGDQFEDIDIKRNRKSVRWGWFCQGYYI